MLRTQNILAIPLIENSVFLQIRASVFFKRSPARLRSHNFAIRSKSFSGINVAHQIETGGGEACAIINEIAVCPWHGPAPHTSVELTSFYRLLLRYTCCSALTHATYFAADQVLRGGGLFLCFFCRATTFRVAWFRE